MRECSDFIDLHELSSLCSTTCWRDLTFLYWIFLPPLLKINWSWVSAFISVPSLLFHWSTVGASCCCYLVPKVYLTLLWPRGLWPDKLLLSMGFPRQEYWSRLPFPSAGDLPALGIKPVSPAWTGGFLAPESLEKLNTLFTASFPSLFLASLLSFLGLLPQFALESLCGSLFLETPNHDKQCQKQEREPFLMVQWLRLWAPLAGGLSLIPGWGTRSHVQPKIPHAASKTRCRQVNKNILKSKKEYSSLYSRSLLVIYFIYSVCAYAHYNLLTYLSSTFCNNL